MSSHAFFNLERKMLEKQTSKQKGYSTLPQTVEYRSTSTFAIFAIQSQVKVHQMAPFLIGTLETTSNLIRPDEG